MDEQVMVFTAELLGRLGCFRGFSSNVDAYIPSLLDPDNVRFLPRSRAEDDPSFKQVVPYVVLRCGEFVYCYERGRKGTEARLHQLLSLGIGGHICQSDGPAGTQAYEAGLLRELDEEVHIDAGFRRRMIGMVHDDTSPVGAVHFGIVHLFDLAAPRVTFRDPALANACFRPFDEAVALRHRFESWSAFVIDHLRSQGMPSLP
jgi:predicted NUDIX family phosphoesterase